MKLITWLDHGERPCPRCGAPLFRLWEVHCVAPAAAGCLRCQSWANQGGRSVQVLDVVLTTS